MRLATATARISDGRRRDGRQVSTRRSIAQCLAFRLASRRRGARRASSRRPRPYAESGECARLRAAIASAPRGGGGQAAGAASRQRAELARTSAYANSIGCNNQKFLFFGSEPPPQCGEIRGPDRPHAGLALGSRGALRRRPRRSDRALQCRMRRGRRPSSRATSSRRLFGGGAKPQPSPISRSTRRPFRRTSSSRPSRNRSRTRRRAPTRRPAPTRSACAPATAASSRSPTRARASRLEDVCRSLCPNADVQLYSFPFGGTIEQAVSLTRRALRRHAERAQVPAVLRSDLLVPPQGRELGAGAGRGRGEIRPRGAATSW